MQIFRSHFHIKKQNLFNSKLKGVLKKLGIPDFGEISSVMFQTFLDLTQ